MAFLKDHCVRCHNAEKQKGDMRLDSMKSRVGDGADAQLWQDVLDIINLGDMPPESVEQPPPPELG